MTNANPPKEREEKTIAPDQLHDWLKTHLAELIDFVEARQAGLLISDDVPVIEGEFARKKRAVCCRHGRATFRIPCRNPEYPGCPYRDKTLDFFRVDAARARHRKYAR